MSDLTIHPDSATTNVTSPPPMPVYVNGLRRRDLHVENWSILPAPDFARAKIVMAMSGRYRPNRRIEDVGVLPAIGESLQIRLADVGEHVVFDGYVSRHLAGAGPDEESLAIEAENVLATRLNHAIGGRRQENEASAKFVPTGKCVFNTEPTGLASEETYQVNSRSCRIFSADSGGQLWSVADILNYLLACCVPSDIDAFGYEEPESPAWAIYPPRLSLTGLPVREALARTAALAGLSIRSGWGGGPSSLIFYRPGRTGRRRAIRLQRAGETLDGERSNLWKGKVAFNRRPARREVSIIGDLKRYESTFTLKKGWDTALESYHYRDFIRDESDDWPAASEVFRKWVLNESGQYCDGPGNLEKFDFADISSDDFLLSINRRFEPCLSVNPSGESLGIVVEVSYDDGAAWRRYGGAIRVARDECAIYLSDDALPADYFQAVAIDATIKVRVTATLASDRHISAEVSGDVSVPTEIIQIPSAQWSKVHDSSIFYQCQDLPAPAERDDSARLKQLAHNISESNAGIIEADLTLGRIDPTCNVGDIIEQIEGRGLTLGGYPGSWAYVRAVEHRCGEEWATHLKVSG